LYQAIFSKIRHSRCSTKLIKYRSDLWSCNKTPTVSC
jgi:hypothetical protein